MGTTAHVVVAGDPALEPVAMQRLRELERKWTRFSPASELSVLNKLSGRTVLISEDTYRAVERAVEGWELSGGLFDPTVHDAIVAAGYDRSFDELATAGDAATCAPGAFAPAPGCRDIQLLETVRAVRLPDGVHLDLGGVGKGWAADVVAAEMLAAGADGVCVNVGGDLRIVGEPPTGHAWTVAIDDPFRPGREVVRIAARTAAVATTSRLRRAWTRAGHEVHHIIDPRTGRPAATGVAAVTVIAGEAWLAEVLAKVVCLTGHDDLLAQFGASAFIVYGDGDTRWTPGFDAFAA